MIDGLMAINLARDDLHNALHLLFADKDDDVPVADTHLPPSLGFRNVGSTDFQSFFASFLLDVAFMVSE